MTSDITTAEQRLRERMSRLESVFAHDIAAVLDELERLRSEYDIARGKFTALFHIHKQYAEQTQAERDDLWASLNEALGRLREARDVLDHGPHGGLHSIRPERCPGCLLEKDIDDFLSRFTEGEKADG